MIPLRDSQPSHSIPFVTVALILANVIVFFYELSLHPAALNQVFYTFGVVPARLEPSTLVTSMFLHGGWFHLIGNMWFLWIYGDNVEDVLGRFKYLLFYLLCGILAGLTHAITHMESQIPTIGASGAVAGVMGAYLVKFPRSRIVTLVPVFVFVTTVQLPAYLILLYWFLIQFISGVGSIGNSHLSQGGVAWLAHVGGFLVGGVLILVLRPKARYRRRRDYH